ncbi:reverse transcriptase domain-containing protein [Tanacetum coccineum]|uniref:Reverse transcriptase domain-containing protein n=1 Tax=Tanacetum coccineum TaxID=301880 RepID=A0ABQ5GFQ0_9ASTR
MTTVNQGTSVEEIEQIVAQRVADAIEAIAIYETKTNMAREAMSQTKRQGDKVAENASNKRKLEPTMERALAKYGNCKRVGHQTEDCRTPVPKAKPRPSMEKPKAEVTCYECGNLGHY